MSGRRRSRLLLLLVQGGGRVQLTWVAILLCILSSYSARRVRSRPSLGVRSGEGGRGRRGRGMLAACWTFLLRIEVEVASGRLPLGGVGVDGRR